MKIYKVLVDDDLNAFGYGYCPQIFKVGLDELHF